MNQLISSILHYILGWFSDFVHGPPKLHGFNVFQVWQTVWLALHPALAGMQASLRARQLDGPYQPSCPVLPSSFRMGANHGNGITCERCEQVPVSASAAQLFSNYSVCWGQNLRESERMSSLNWRACLAWWPREVNLSCQQAVWQGGSVAVAALRFWIFGWVMNVLSMK